MQLQQELQARGLTATAQRDHRVLLVPLGGDDTYDVVRDAVADLALPLCAAGAAPAPGRRAVPRRSREASEASKESKESKEHV